MEWIFEGLGTALITLIIGLFTGGTIGYRIGIKKSKVIQKQKAKNDAKQIQIGKDFHGR
ncbi:MAG: hypothetical protein LBP40_01700 [Campylobacteraceae bacterium]|jgi:hypothetical protein|nr:hypothetical protein [Campylobacteraceae bacterium]